MVEGVPSVFRNAGGDRTASYDWFDFATGAAYKEFDACGAANSAGSIYFLSNQTFDADSTNLQFGDSADLDFDINFSTPVVIASADAFINFTSYNNTGAKTNTIVFTLYHVTTTGVETSLGTVTCTATSANPFYLRKCTKFAVTSKAVAIGEKLRLNVVHSDDGGTSYIYIDPKSRVTQTETGSGATIGTDLKINIPFKVDI